MGLTRRTPLARSGLIARAPVNAKSKAQAAVLRKLDDLCRKICFRRDGGRCVRCGRRGYLEWAHVYTRKILATRWSLENCMSLCGVGGFISNGCHGWWHNPPRLVTPEQYAELHGEPAGEGVLMVAMDGLAALGDGAVGRARTYYVTTDPLVARPLDWWEARTDPRVARRLRERIQKPTKVDFDEVELTLKTMWEAA